MNQDEFKRILNEALDPLNKHLDGIDGRLDGIDGRLDGIDGRLDGIDGRLDGIDGRLDGIEEQLNNPDTGLAALNSRMDTNTAAIMELESTIKSYADAYKTNKANIERLDERTSKLEEYNGITPPPELIIHR